jgi:hypothetical protein
MASIRSLGSLSRSPFCGVVDSGTLCRQSSPVPGPAGLIFTRADFLALPLTPPVKGLDQDFSAQDKAEYEVLKKMPVVDLQGKKYLTMEAYVAARTRFFGPSPAFWAYASQSDAELVQTQWKIGKRTVTLRSRLELEDDLDQQKIFYRWLRKAYQKKYGADADVPGAIKAGASQELLTKIAAVKQSTAGKSAHADSLSFQTFNARPMKAVSGYILGTLSEHASGLAVDIDPDHNPQLSLPQWQFIEKLAQKTVKRSGRWTTEAEARALWSDIKELSDLFVKKVAAEKQRLEEEDRAAELAHPKKAKPKPLLQRILAPHSAKLARFADSGFIQLPLDLVLELRNAGFDWGAAFPGNVDIMHFELRTKTK